MSAKINKFMMRNSLKTSNLIFRGSAHVSSPYDHSDRAGFSRDFTVRFGYEMQLGGRFES